MAIVGGSAYTDDYVKKLHRLASNNNQIIFTDFQSGKTVDQLYTNSLALIHPSFNEGLPITVIEAMSYGKPVLLSNIAEHIELGTDYNLIFKDNDVKELEDKMLYFINLSEEEKMLLSKQNKIIVEEKYHWKKLIPQILTVYEKENLEALNKRLITENI
jgi:glycosyltransferase involved in cell wall biosynthesis